MRPHAPLALLLCAAALGCGVPDNAALIARINAAQDAPKEREKETPESQKPLPDVKQAEQDPIKLGMGIVDVVPGTGRAAAPGDTCYMLYTGKLKSDPTKVFDSTAKHDDQPFSFVLGGGQVIKGWDLGIKGMKEGGKRTLTIPANLAYGNQGQGDDIPPNSDLVFDIELLALLKPEDGDTVLRETIKPGVGPAAKDGDVVTFKYAAKLVNGKTIDDNGGKSVQVKLGSGTLAAPGLELALKGMKLGQEIVATVPPALGLQPVGPNGNKVPPNSVMRFDVTLVKIG